MAAVKTPTVMDMAIRKMIEDAGVLGFMLC
jgi:hypothetical protein